MRSFRRCKWTVVLICLVVLVCAADSVNGGEVECDTIQHRLDRLYFSAGEELRVFRHARFTVYRDTDTVYTGIVEHAYQGVSVSQPTQGFFDSMAVGPLYAIIESAEIDSSAVIRIGTLLGGVIIGPGITTEEPVNSAEKRPHQRVDIRPYQHFSTMAHDFQNGLLDGYFSFKEPVLVPEGTVIFPHRFSHLVALVPNVGRPYTQYGQLTTSLYYRFDTKKLLLLFDGDRISPVNSFLENGDSTRRPYPHDPGLGKALFQALPERPKYLSLCPRSAMLRQLATYFADILSRDRCAVELTDNWWSADIRFELVPISDENPSAGIYFLHQQLVGDSVSGLPTNEAIRIISSYFRTVSATRNQEQYYYFLHRAEEAMIEDIGVFPLFRPTLFFVAHKHLQGVNFDKSGHLDCSYLARLLLPSVHAESER